MHVKRLYSPTVRDALAAAREQLGPDALVLSTELVPAPGWRGWIGGRIVRLTAAANRDFSDVDAAEVSGDRRPRPSGRHSTPAGRAGVIARLTAIGFDPALAASVAGRLSEAECRGGSEQALRRAVAAELESLSAGDGGRARYEVFVGPPGAGKTTTIAKIAAQECAAGRPGLGLVAADAFRPGAVEQLRSYADVIGVPCRIARSPDELDRALTASRHHTLVDTAGRSTGDPALGGWFQVLDRRADVRTHLVLAADTPEATTRRLLDRYAALRPSRVVITKIDEADTMMPLLAAVRERGLPVSYLAAGQRVPEDLWRATPASLAAALLREPAVKESPWH